jgi:putative tryptophan/tyrosine transport system substrate-binding protein
MRRRFLLAASAGAAAFPAQAQKPPRVGYLVSGDPEPTWKMFRTAMAELGYEDKRNITFEFRGADAASDRLDVFARELAGLPVDVIVAVNSPAVAAARRATSTLPIVFNGGAPDIGAVANIARPESNLTGASGPGTVLAGKCVQLFHEMKPLSRAIGLLLNVPDPFHVPLRRDVEAAARAQGLELVAIPMKAPGELAAGFDELVRRGVDGVLAQPTLGLEVAARLALERRLPAFSFRLEFVEAGGLMAYGADQADINRMVANHVVKILKGARPGDLPVQRATHYKLIVNQKTAAALGFAIPAPFLARVDEVIE